MPKRNDEIKQVNAANPNDPAYCPHCGKLSMASFPLHLREKDGTDTIICQVVKCAICDRMKNYGGVWAIGKLSGRVMKTDYANWPELKRNNIMPEEFLDAIFKHPEGHIWLDAQNGLDKVKPEGTQAELLKRWDNFIKRQGRFWRAYD